MIDCESARQAIANRLAGAVDDASLRELAIHLKTCPDCADDARVLDGAVGALKDEQVPDPGPVYWASFGSRLRDRISLSRGRSRRRTAALLTMAAALATVLAMQAMRAGRSTHPDPGSPDTFATVQTASNEDEMDRLRQILERASKAKGGRSVLRAVLDDLGPADPLEFDEALEGLTQEESAILGRELSELKS